MRDGTTLPTTPPSVSERMPASSSTTQRHDNAIKAGIEYLAERQREDGCWQDYLIFESVADSYVTAFVGHMLLDLSDDGVRPAVDAAFNWLAARPADERWRFAPQTARDADSTLWVLRLAERLGRQDEVEDGYAFVDGHVGPNGGVRAYQVEDYLERFGNGTHLTGWFGEHICVTAGAAGLRHLASRDVVLDCLRRGQDADGSWPVYWWLDREYATVFAAEALAASGDSGDGERIDRAVSWLRDRFEHGLICPPQLPDGSPWLTALALRLLLLTGREARLSSLAAEALRRAQEDDGSWRPSAFMRAPYYHEVEPDDSRWLEPQERSDSYNTLFPDHNRCMTTAMVVNALGLAARPT